MKRIHVVEDEPQVARLLASGLSYKGFEVSVTSSGTEALNRMAESMPDIVILDVMLPDIDGFEVCRRLRSSHTNVPILMLTARSAVADKVAGLDCGADDYLTKPFDFEELLARVRARTRQEAQPHSLAKKIIVGDLVIDPASRQVWRAGQLIELTKREYDLLEVLARNTGQVITQSIFFQRVWGDDLDVGSEVLKVSICTLRKKLNAHGQENLIHSVRGVGYMLKPA
jgi:two-component system, OmpR family, response regulator MprA